MKALNILKCLLSIVVLCTLISRCKHKQTGNNIETFCSDQTTTTITLHFTQIDDPLNQTPMPVNYIFPWSQTLICKAKTLIWVTSIRHPIRISLQQVQWFSQTIPSHSKIKWISLSYLKNKIHKFTPNNQYYQANWISERKHQANSSIIQQN